MTLERPAPQDRSSADPALAALFELGGAGVAVTEFSDAADGLPAGPGLVRIGVHRAGPLPTVDLDAFDILLSAEAAAPRPWVGLGPARLDETIAALRAVVADRPAAAAIAAQVLRTSLQLTFEQALIAESLGYSVLLASGAFQTWRAGTRVRRRPDAAGPRVLLDRDGADIRIRLNRGVRNAFDARMRDELVEALEFALLDPDAAGVVLSGLGPVFSTGGDLDEFGRADDVGRAHLIRTLRSPARLVHALGGRMTARLHGACIGAGIEVPAAAARVVARPGTFFRLPEVSMGLIPGAGGTASIPRRIGRHRACYMAIAGCDIDLETALAWGLVDEMDSTP